MDVAEITKIKPQKNKKRVNIYLDGKFAFGLDADNFLKSGLKISQKLSEKEVEELIFKNESQKLLDRTYRLLSYRPRSEKEIEDYLKKKKTTPKLSSWVIKKLKKQGHLNDEEFARWLIEQRSTFRPRGKLALKVELAQKGIDRQLAEKLIDQMVDELPLAKKLAKKKIKTYQKLDRWEFRKKMTAFLSRRGFSWETIKTVIDDIAKKR